VSIPITTAAIAAHADQRLAALLEEAVRYHAGAMREAASPMHPWAGMIDTVNVRATAVHELALLAYELGDPDAARSIDATVNSVVSQLIDLAFAARKASIPRSFPATPKEPTP